MSKPILIYAAGPQDDVSKEQARGWREDLAAMAPVGVSIFSPAHAYFNVSEASFLPVDRINRMVIAHSHAVIANLSGPGLGFGTVREIEFAAHHGTIVAVVGEVPSLMRHDLLVCDTLDAALTAVLEKVHDERQQPQWQMVDLGRFGFGPPPGMEGDDQ